MSAVMAVSLALFAGSFVGLLVARRRLGRAVEAQRLEAHVARELAQFDRRCAEKSQREGEGPPGPVRFWDEPSQGRGTGRRTGA